MEAKLGALVMGEDASELATYLEGFELDLGHRDLSVEASLSVYKVQLAAYLLLGQLDDARFLWKRLPTPPRDNEPELCALWAVGKAMWLKDHAATQGAITGFSWSPPLMGTLMERLQRAHLTRCFSDAVRTYSLVLPESLSTTLGVPIETVHQVCALLAPPPRRPAAPPSSHRPHARACPLPDGIGCGLDDRRRVGRLRAVRLRGVEGASSDG